MNKIAVIRDSLCEFDNYEPCEKDVALFENFEELTQEEIKTLVTSYKQNFVN